MTDDYQPFPHAELTEYAAADSVKERAGHLRNAVACFAALNQRCLIAELERDQLSAELRKLTGVDGGVSAGSGGHDS